MSGSNTLLSYTVQEGDSLAGIASKFDVNVNSIIWANNFDKNTVLHPNDVIRIPPVIGLAYTVEAGDTMESLAQKYKVDSSKIAQQNKLGPKQELLIGQQILIPGAVKINPPKVIPPVISKKEVSLAKKEDPKKKLFVKAAPKKKEFRTYATGYTGRGSKFAWGNCTYFVANHKNVTWHGNANSWLRNAAAAGVPTGNNPVPGAIVSFQGSGYNPYYGHVGLVVSVDGDDVVVKDMNYRRLNEVTIRRVPKNDGSIRGYIYTD